MYSALTTTSMSAPSVTAAATAVYQYLRDGHYHRMVHLISVIRHDSY